MAGNKLNALEAYKNSEVWREAFAIAQELKYSSNDLFLLSKELSGIYLLGYRFIIKNLPNLTSLYIFFRKIGR